FITRNHPNIAELPYVVITSAGSFFSDYEIEKSTRLEIMRRLRNAGISRFACESEAKYCLDRQHLSELRDGFGGQITVGIGVESSDSYVRNVAINKGLRDITLHSAVENLKALGIGFYFYLLLGKPFLTEDSDLWDVVHSVLVLEELTP